jgi:hypothetical protein
VGSGLQAGPVRLSGQQCACCPGDHQGSAEVGGRSL